MGCSSSQVILPKPVSINEILPQSVRFLENCLVIWISNESMEKFEKEQEQLRKCLHGLIIFHHIDGCLTFISSIENEKIFLIISGSSKTIESFQHLSQLERIYVFNTTHLQTNSMKYRDLNDEILTDIDHLCEQLQNDLRLCEMDSIPLTIVLKSSKPIANKEEAAFLLGQMIKEIIHRLKFESGAKDVFIDFCRHYYENNDEQLLIIDDFAKNYRPHQALTWLRRRCFLSQILNRALRTREIDIIYKLGFFIKHLNLQLNRQHDENPSDMKNISFAYRGKTMLYEEFENRLKNASGHLLSFPDFLLATINKELAIDFIHQRLTFHPHRTGVIFQINLDQMVFSEKNPFALLKDTNQDLICFHMSAVFRIQSIEQTMNNGKIIWVITLKTMTDDDPQFLSLTTSVRSNEMHANPALYLGRLLVDMGEYRRAEQVLLGLLDDPSVRSQPRRLVRAHNGLGAVYTYRNEHTKALYHYQQLLQISLTYLQSNHPDLSSVYSAIGNSYFTQKKYHLAMENYEKAMELLQYSIQPVSAEIVAHLTTRMNEIRCLMK